LRDYKWEHIEDVREQTLVSAFMIGRQAWQINGDFP